MIRRREHVSKSIGLWSWIAQVAGSEQVQQIQGKCQVEEITLVDIGINTVEARLAGEWEANTLNIDSKRSTM